MIVKKKTTWVVIVATLISASVAGLLVTAPPTVTRALGEYFRPTTVEMLPLPAGCLQTDQLPPPSLAKIVESQRAHYRLSLQKVIGCKTKDPLPPAFANQMLHNDLGERWLPLYVGCCSYKTGRHVAVIVAGSDGSGSVLVEAAMIQSRWDYLRMGR